MLLTPAINQDPSKPAWALRCMLSYCETRSRTHVSTPSTRCLSACSRRSSPGKLLMGGTRRLRSCISHGGRARCGRFLRPTCLRRRMHRGTCLKRCMTPRHHPLSSMTRSSHPRENAKSIFSRHVRSRNFQGMFLCPRSLTVHIKHYRAYQGLRFLDFWRVSRARIILTCRWT